MWHRGGAGFPCQVFVRQARVVGQVLAFQRASNESSNSRAMVGTNRTSKIAT